MILFMLLACVAQGVLVASLGAGVAALGSVYLVLVLWLIVLTVRLEILSDTLKRLESRLNLIFEEREREYRKLVEGIPLDARGRE